MPGSTSISRKALLSLGATALLALSWSTHARAADDPTKNDEDEFKSTPYTEYGEFNEEEDEAADTHYFQNGRFFGVGLGMGYEGAAGNRGALWQGGFPVIDFKVLYWFDFNLSLDLQLTTANHNYNASVPAGGTKRHSDISMTHLGVDLRYSIDTRNLAAPISFVNPYVILGLGSFTKTESNPTDAAATQQDSSFEVDAGAGFEFAIKPRKTYFHLESKVYMAQFKDTYSTAFQDASPKLTDLTGIFYTLTGNLVFTW